MIVARKERRILPYDIMCGTVGHASGTPTVWLQMFAVNDRTPRQGHRRLRIPSSGYCGLFDNPI